jgi:hypothetical protein
MKFIEFNDSIINCDYIVCLEFLDDEGFNLILKLDQVDQIELDYIDHYCIEDFPTEEDRYKRYQELKSILVDGK